MSSTLRANAFVNLSAGALDVLSGEGWIYRFHCNEADTRFARPAFHFFTPSMRYEIRTLLYYNSTDAHTPSQRMILSPDHYNHLHAAPPHTADWPLTLERIMHTALWGGWQGRAVYGLPTENLTYIPSLRRAMLEAWRREALLREAEHTKRYSP